MNGLNMLVKRLRKSDCIKNYALFKKSTLNIKTEKLKIKRWRKSYRANSKRKLYYIYKFIYNCINFRQFSLQNKKSYKK